VTGPKIDAMARYRVWHGSAQPPDQRRELVAGPLRALLVGPDLRYVRFGSVELIQRVYVAVRDTAWNTVPGTMAGLEVIQRDDDFEVRFRQRHTYRDVDFGWQGTIKGSAEGVLTYEMDGAPLASFRHNKIGMNVHHPLSEYVGRPYRAATPQGEIAGTLGWEIAPQLVSGGTLTAMFPFFDHLDVDVASGGTVTFDFEGDQFEMQDHRNWSDGNYKTYGTPLALGYPLDATEGRRIRQIMTVRYKGSLIAVNPTAPVEIRVGEPSARHMPAIGLGMASHGGDLTGREIRLLRLLRPAHVRVDLHPRAPSYRDEWARAVRAAESLGCALEVAFFVTESARDQAAELASLVAASSVPLARLLVFEEAEGFSELRGASAPETVRAVRAVLRTAGIACPVAGGTNQFFNELNRARPEVAGTDGVAYSLNPQVHAGDDLSLADNLLAQPDIVRFTRRICGDVGVSVTPVTLIGRAGPFPSGPPEDGGLPGAVDVRQASLLGAAWTTASIKQLTAGGADSLTYFETTGWRGVLEVEAGPPMPDRFPSRSGDAFPLYHVFADVADWSGGQPMETTSTEANVADALAVRDQAGTHALLANLTPDLRRVRLGPLGGAVASLRVLDDATVAVAARDPEAFRAAPQATQPLDDGWLSLTLTPHAVVRVDVAGATSSATATGGDD
jgi:D-apionolactonase